MSSYKTLCTRFYDLDKPEAPDVGLRFYLPHIERATGPTIELMCGSGRYLEPILAAGHDVDGTDASAEMLAACTRRISRNWPNAGIFLQQIDALDLPRSYGLAIVTSGSFSLLTDMDLVRRSLHSIFDVLLPDGALVGEIQGYDPHKPSGSSTYKRSVTTETGGEIALTSVTQYDAAAAVEFCHADYVLVENGVEVDVEHEELGLRYYEQAAFQHLLEEAGFIDVKFDTAYPDTSAEDMDGVLLFSCQRPA